jgi:hypothetical protein
MAKVSLEKGCDRSFLQQKLPEICNQIKTKYKEYQQEILRARQTKLENELKSAIYELKKRGEFASPKRVSHISE